MIPSGRGAPNQISGLHRLAEECGLRGKTMVEIGSYRGESTAIFALYASRIFAVDPWKNGFDSADPICAFVEQAEKEFDLVASSFPNIVKKKMTSMEFAAIAEPVHLVYIDGRHQYDSVVEDCSTWGGKVLPGGFLAGHDWQHEPVALAVLDTMGRPPDEIFEDDSWMYRM